MIRVNAISFLNYTVSGALTLLIPLLLLERNMNLAEIGVILSILPLIFLVSRLLFAAIADKLGWSHIFLLINWPTTITATIMYYFANSTSVFLVGKITEGLREASYWAVIRTAIYSLAPINAAKEAVKNNAIIWTATASGGAIAGLGIAQLGFSNTLMLLTTISLAAGIPAILIWKNWTNNPQHKTHKLFTGLKPNGKPKTFWIGSLALVFNSISAYPLITLLLPVFMNQQLNYDYLTIGTLFLVFNAIAAAAAFLGLKTPLNRNLAISLSALSIIASIFLATTTATLFILCLIALAFVRGYGIGFFEYTVATVTKDSKNISIDIGLLHMPQRLAEFTSLLTAGFLAQILGFTPVFILMSCFFGLFTLTALYVIKNKNQQAKTIQAINPKQHPQDKNEAN